MSRDGQRAYYESERITLASGARTTSGSSASRNVQGNKDGIFFLDITAVSGTSPSATVAIESSPDGGTTWFPVSGHAFAAATAVGKQVLKLSNFGDTIRESATITGSSVAASLTTALTGLNNDLTYTADTAGAAGNDITVAYVNPGTASAALAVTVTGSAISVSLATDASSVITSTAALVRDAVNAHATASTLVTAANATGNDGTGVVTALAATNLTGGVDLSLTYTVKAVI